MSIEEKVKTIVAEFVSQPFEVVAGQTRLIDDLGMDSLDAFEIAMDIEGEFGIEIPDEDADAWKTVQDIITYIEKRKQPA